MDDIVSRLKTYMNHIGLPSTQFADYASIPRPTISQILNGRNKKISNELIAKLHTAFPTLNILWLMFGDGDMETKPNIKISEPDTPPTPSQIDGEIDDKESDSNHLGGIFADDLHLRNSNMDEFFDENVNNEANVSNEADKSKAEIISASPIAPTHVNPNRTIKYIMVYYSDNTFEVFSPDVNFKK